jgi:hypothetical protein
MTKEPEIKVDTPEIVHTAATQIKATGEFKQGLTGQEIEGMMKGIVGGVLQGNPSVEAKVPFMSVSIMSGKGEAKATIRIERPIRATVTANIVLGNEKTGKNAIVLDGLKVNTKADNLAGRIALGAINVEARVRKALANPTQALTDYLGGELRKDGVHLEGIAMKFTQDDRLTVLLRGKAM